MLTTMRNSREVVGLSADAGNKFTEVAMVGRCRGLMRRGYPTYYDGMDIVFVAARPAASA
jgi:hypothetical protein